jgi:hypothetical protein
MVQLQYFMLEVVVAQEFITEVLYQDKLVVQVVKVVEEEVPL